MKAIEEKLQAISDVSEGMKVEVRIKELTFNQVYKLTKKYKSNTHKPTAESPYYWAYINYSDRLSALIQTSVLNVKVTFETK